MGAVGPRDHGVAAPFRGSRSCGSLRSEYSRTAARTISDIGMCRRNDASRSRWYKSSGRVIGTLCPRSSGRPPSPRFTGRMISRCCGAVRAPRHHREWRGSARHDSGSGGFGFGARAADRGAEGVTACDALPRSPQPSRAVGALCQPHAGESQRVTLRQQPTVQHPYG